MLFKVVAAALPKEMVNSRYLAMIEVGKMQGHTRFRFRFI